jgi:precorrin-6B C5,15-methyltransferase / cobalt-precorrin-6B C5,C15-methyltransferase
VTAWLHVVGIGDDGLGGLPPRLRRLVESADLVVGGKRHLAMLGDLPVERLLWRTPLIDTLPEIRRRAGRRVVVLNTGDPMWYGVGELLCRELAPGEIEVHPAPSAFSLVCARLGWSMREIATISLHGRPVERLRRVLAPEARIVALSTGPETPGAVARLLVQAGYGDSRIWVLEHMGSERERRIEGIARDWSEPPVADLNTVAISCVAEDRTPRGTAPGLPDEAFRHDGMLTKREVRAITLARLMPMPRQLLWDVGAGSGAVAIEWILASGHGRAVAIEREPARVAMIRDNAEALGTPELEIVEGTAPDALNGLEPPDAVFIGGGVGEVLARCHEALRPGGRLVANVVTVEGEQALASWHARRGGELVRLQVARARPVGRLRGWRPLMAVTQYALVKR